jgi:hypothetical protein
VTAEVLVPWLTSQFFTAQGQPLAGGLLYSYQAGTSTPVQTFTDSTGSQPNANPVVANSRGEMSVWITNNVAYKFVLTDSAGNTIWTRDQVVATQLLTLYGGVDTGSSTLYILTFLSPFTTYAAFTGNPIFWIPSNNNSGAASINVNGIGVVGIYNPDGSQLGANQILAGRITEIVYQTNIAGSGNSGFVLFPGGNLNGSTVGTFGPETVLASATTTDLGTALAHTVVITGTTTITSFGTSASLLAPYYLIRFTSALQLTYNAVSMQLPGNTNIITSPGDSAIAQYLGNGDWRIAFYQYATSASSSNAKIKPSDTVGALSSTTLVPDPDLQSNTLAVGRYSWEILLIFDSVNTAAGFKWTNDGTAVDSRAAAPAVASGFVSGAAYGPKAESPYNTTITYATVGTGNSSNVVLYKGSLLVSTVGTFGISWAQGTSEASATTLRAGSYLTLTLMNTGSTAGTVTRTYTTPGSFTETIPAGFNTLTIECWGSSAGGGVGFGSGLTTTGGGGGGSAGYSRSTVTVTGLAGDTLNYTVAAAGAAGFSGETSSVSSGTLAITTMTCTGGIFGTAATGTASPGTGGAGGTATGGTVVNTNGNAGQTGQTQTGSPPGLGGAGGAGIAGIFNGGAVGGRGGGIGVAQAGGGGIVIFNYS